MLRMIVVSILTLLIADAFLSPHDSGTLLVPVAHAQQCGYKSDGKYHCGTNCGYKGDGKYHCGTNCGYKGDGKYHCVGEESQRPPTQRQPVKPPEQQCGFKSDGKYHCGTNCGYKGDGKFHCGTNCGYKGDGKYRCVGE